MPKFKSIKVHLTLPYIGGIEGTWEPDEAERKASWEMYVELITRISLVELSPGEGLLEESLSSLHSLFDTTRKILKEHGPSVAQPKGENNLSFGYIAVAILNTVLRPTLTKWHPILMGYQSERQPDVSAYEHENTWDKNNELRQTLNEVRSTLVTYADLLAQVAGVPSLIF